MSNVNVPRLTPPAPLVPNALFASRFCSLQHSLNPRRCSTRCCILACGSPTGGSFCATCPAGSNPDSASAGMCIQVHDRMGMYFEPELSQSLERSAFCSHDLALLPLEPVALSAYPSRHFEYKGMYTLNPSQSPSIFPSYFSSFLHFSLSFCLCISLPLSIITQSEARPGTWPAAASRDAAVSRCRCLPLRRGRVPSWIILWLLGCGHVHTRYYFGAVSRALDYLSQGLAPTPSLCISCILLGIRHMHSCTHITHALNLFQSTSISTPFSISIYLSSHYSQEH
jgi:hypothetical protein